MTYIFLPIILSLLSRGSHVCIFDCYFYFIIHQRSVHHKCLVICMNLTLFYKVEAIPPFYEGGKFVLHHRKTTLRASVLSPLHSRARERTLCRQCPFEHLDSEQKEAKKSHWLSRVASSLLGGNFDFASLSFVGETDNFA